MQLTVWQGLQRAFSETEAAIRGVSIIWRFVVCAGTRMMQIPLGEVWKLFWREWPLLRIGGCGFGAGMGGRWGVLRSFREDWCSGWGACGVR